MKKWEASGQTQSAVAKTARLSVHTSLLESKLQAAHAGKPVKSGAFVEVPVRARSEVRIRTVASESATGSSVGLSDSPPQR